MYVSSIFDLIIIIFSIIYFILLFVILKKFGLKNLIEDKLFIIMTIFSIMVMLFILKEVLHGYWVW